MKNNLFKAFGLGLFLVLSLGACKDDPCKDKNCGDYGTCNSTGDCDCQEGYALDAAGACATCATGYDGYPDCQMINAKFIATYSVATSCLGNTYTSTIEAGKDNAGVVIPDQILIKNLGNTDGLNVKATVSGNSVTIISGVYLDGAGDSWTISGTGTRIEAIGTITINATVSYTYSGTNYLCTEVWTKQ